MTNRGVAPGDRRRCREQSTQQSRTRASRACARSGRRCSHRHRRRLGRDGATRGTWLGDPVRRPNRRLCLALGQPRRARGVTEDRAGRVDPVSLLDHPACRPEQASVAFALRTRGDVVRQTLRTTQRPGRRWWGSRSWRFEKIPQTLSVERTGLVGRGRDHRVRGLGAVDTQSRWRDDDIPTITAEVDMSRRRLPRPLLAAISGVRHCGARIVGVQSARRSANEPGPSVSDARRTSALERRIPTAGAMDINVHHIQPRPPSRRDADVRLGRTMPPLRHRSCRCGGVVESVLRQRPLAAWHAREHRDAEVHISPRCRGEIRR